MALLQEELCEGSSAEEMEHLPETWEVWVKYCLPWGELSLGSAGCAGLLPKWCKHTLPLQKLLGLQDHRARKGEGKQNMNLSSPLVSAPNYKVKIHVHVPDSGTVAFPPF